MSNKFLQKKFSTPLDRTFSLTFFETWKHNYKTQKSFGCERLDSWVLFLEKIPKTITITSEREQKDRRRKKRVN